MKSKPDMVLGFSFPLCCALINQIMSDLSGPGLVLPDFTLRAQTGTLLLFNVKILLVSVCCSVFSCDPERIARWKVHVQSDAPEGHQAPSQDDENLLGPKFSFCSRQLLLAITCNTWDMQTDEEGNIQPGCIYSLWTLINLPVQISAIGVSCFSVYLHHFILLSENKEYIFLI